MYHDLKDCNIVFFGSGDFPIPTFKHLIGCGCKITGLVTSHDSVVFNDKRLYDIAEQYDIPTYIPDDLKDEKFLKWLWGRQADLFCVISYKILPPEVLKIPVIVSFNVHASLLPFLKGPAPIYWAIRNGFKTTGLTSFIMTKKVDDGDIILNKKIDIDLYEETYGSLHEKLSDACCDFTINTIRKIVSIPNLNDCVISQPVLDIYSSSFDNYIVMNAPKITLDDRCCVSSDNYNMQFLDEENISYFPIEQVYRQIRSLSPCFGANYCFSVSEYYLEETEIPFKIYEAELVESVNDIIKEHISSLNRGSNVITDGKNYLYLIFEGEHDKAISIKTIQLEGKKKMNIKDFLNGFKYTKEKGEYLINVTERKEMDNI